jgi:hypothetical protein
MVFTFSDIKKSCILLILPNKDKQSVNLNYNL